jgi:hypothetical protein
MKKLFVVIVCLFLAACGSKSVAYYDTNISEYNRTELNKKDTEHGILGMKVRAYQEDESSLQIVFGMNNVIGDYTRVGDIANNYLLHKSFTGFSKKYFLTAEPDNKGAYVEFNAFNAGTKGITDGIDSPFLLSSYERNIENFKTNPKVKNVVEINNSDFIISYGSNGIVYKSFIANCEISDDSLKIYYYYTAYNGCIVRIMFTFINTTEDDDTIKEYVEKYMKYASLKIMLDTGKITLEEFNSLRGQPDKAYSEITIMTSKN